MQEKETQENLQGLQVISNGKGSRPRTWPNDSYRANYDAIFGVRAARAQMRLITATLNPRKARNKP